MTSNAAPLTPGKVLLVALAALLVSLLAVGIQVARKDARVPVADERVYLGGGAVLAHTGIYSLQTDVLRMPAGGTSIARDHFFTPGTAFIHARLINMSDRFRDFSHCHLLGMKPADQCGDPGPIATGFQILAMALAAWLAWLIAVEITGSRWIAWGMLAILLASGRYGFYARHFLSDTYFAGAVTLAGYLLVRLWKKPGLTAAILLGIVIGLASYIRPTMQYAFYMLLAGYGVHFLWLRLGGKEVRIKPVLSVLFSLAYGAVILPWLVRNHGLTGHYVMSEGYAGYILVQRLAYNAMTLQEWLAAWIYWLPDFGDNLAARIFSDDGVSRLSLTDPAGFYSVGNRSFREEMLAAAGGRERLLPYLMERMKSEFGTHILVTFPLLTHGLWVGKIFGFASFVLALPALFILKRRGQLGLWALFALVPVFLLGLHAFVSINIPRYNLAVLPVMALGASTTLITAGTWMALKLVRRR